MFISIDDYYDIDFYNDALMALEENGVQYSEHINRSLRAWQIYIAT